MSANSVPTSPYFLLYSKVRDIKMGSQSPLSRPPNQMILIKSPPLPPPRVTSLPLAVLLKQVDFNPATAGFRRPGLGVELHDAHHLPTHPSFPPSGFEHTTQCSFLHYHFTTISPFPLFEGFRSLHPTLLRRDLDSLSLASSVYLLHRLIRKRSTLRPPPLQTKTNPLADHVPSAPAPPKWGPATALLCSMCVWRLFLVISAFPPPFWLLRPPPGFPPLFLRFHLSFPTPFVLRVLWEPFGLTA